MTEGFTAVYCGAPGCAWTSAAVSSPDVAGALADAVRRSPHAVLVRSPCLTGCCTASGVPAGAGPLVLVQRCDPERRPTGPATVMGPLHERSDVADLCAWLVAGASDPVPAHLLAATLPPVTTPRAV